MALPTQTLTLCDRTGARFGVIRFAPSESNELKGECIFDLSVDIEDPAVRDEVRWIYKQRYRRAGEHRFKLTESGRLTITQADFKLLLEPDEEASMRTRSSAPAISGEWI
ncbi:MAG: hypothetical protein KC912_24940 [Proteobacteria bacterium]|nr:hypothetical protein [Pseudomonadota bacterium]